MKTYFVKIQFETEKECLVCKFKDDFDDCILQDEVYDNFHTQLLNCPLVEVDGE